MPPIQLLVFPARSCASTTELAIEQRAGVVVFGNGHWPVCWHPTPDRAAFRRCSSQLLACRAESARGQIPREKMSRHAAARSRVRGLFASTINLQPDATGTGLRSERHGQPNLMHDALLDPLGAELNRTEPHHPGPPRRRHFTTLRSSTFPAGQDARAHSGTGAGGCARRSRSEAFSLETAVEMNHEAHETHENKGCE